ncbi:MAG: EAL domain-containing protein [Pseudomonadota bacterium]
MNITGVIVDAALRQRLALLAARAGWECRLCASPEELERPPTLPGRPADLFLCDDPAILDRQPGHGAVEVVLNRGAAASNGSRERLHVDADESDETLLLALATCVNARRIRERLGELERTEPITHLPRREQLLDALSACHSRPLGLLVIQVDHAAHLYEGLDPVSRTDLLSALAGHMERALPAQGRLGFFDAACFLVALPEVTEAALADHARAMVRELAAPLAYRHGELHLTASVGYAFEARFSDAERLWSEAWSAMRRAVADGGNRAEGPERPSGTAPRPDAVEREEFSLMLQPQLSADGARLTGAEALLRWQGMEVGGLGPARFVPLAEQQGQMGRIGDWVLGHACTEAAGWLDQHPSPLILGVNVSPQQFHNDALVKRVGHYHAERWFDPAMLELELPLEAFLTLVDDYRRQLYRLRDWGVRFALDNLGSGLIDAAKLLRCPADTLKIDRALVARVNHDPGAWELVSQICQLGNRFELRVIAVGVEDGDALATLQSLGCTEVQGYLYSPPLPPGDFRSMLAREGAGRND